MGQSRRSDVDGNQQGADQQNPRRQGTNNFHRGRGGSQSTRQPYQFFPITQNTLKKFAEENAEPSDIVKKFTEEDTGLKQFLKENSNKQDYCDSIELVLLVLGGFCQKNGVTEFGHGFIRIVKVFIHFISLFTKRVKLNFVSFKKCRFWVKWVCLKLLQMLSCSFHDQMPLMLFRKTNV